MSRHKLSRLEQDIKSELSIIFRDVKDPRVGEMLSIVDLELAGDLGVLKIFISSFEGPEVTAKSIEGLKSASGMIKAKLGERVKMRKMPELRFFADVSMEHAANITKKINEVNE